MCFIESFKIPVGICHIMQHTMGLFVCLLYFRPFVYVLSPPFHTRYKRMLFKSLVSTSLKSVIL